MLNSLINTKIKPYSKLILLACLLIIFTDVDANDGKGTIPSRPPNPVSYYQWFMIALAITYTVWLTVRAQKRKSKLKAQETEND